MEMLQNVDRSIYSIDRTQHARKEPFRSRIIEIARDHGAVRPRDLERVGVPREYLLRMMREGVVRRTRRGIYQISDHSPTEHHSLAVVAKEVPKAVICLLSTLPFHELTTQHPAEVWVGIHVRARSPKVTTVSFRVVRYSEETIGAGVQIHQIEGTPVQVFTPAKTVADCFKYRNKVGQDIAIEALRDVLLQKKAKIAEIMRFAELNRVPASCDPILTL